MGHLSGDWDETVEEPFLEGEELREAQEEAQRILAQPVKQYDYNDPSYRGGPRNLPDDVLMAAAIELVTARILVEEIQDRLEEAQLNLWNLMDEQVGAGIPVDAVAEHSGLNHRSSVYRKLRELPKIRAQRDAANRLRATLRRRT